MEALRTEPAVGSPLLPAALGDAEWCAHHHDVFTGSGVWREEEFGRLQDEKEATAALFEAECLSLLSPLFRGRVARVLPGRTRIHYPHCIRGIDAGG